jgi:chloramphenicol 3-O-phosphotransferase
MGYRFRPGEEVLTREMTERGRREWGWATVVARHPGRTYDLECRGTPNERDEGDLRLQCQLAI